MPVEITENIDILNSSSGYYNDICYISTSEKGTDITLKDRKEEFVKNNKTVCQDNCDFKDYDYQIQKAKCSCKVKQSSASSALMNINITEIINNFMDIKNLVNIVILRCNKVLFSKNGIKKNIEFYLNIPIIILHLICIVIFYRVQLYYLKEKIKEIIYGLKNWYLVRREKKVKKKKELEKIKKDRNKDNIITNFNNKKNIQETKSISKKDITIIKNPSIDSNPPKKKRGNNILYLKQNNLNNLNKDNDVKNIIEKKIRK